MHLLILGSHYEVMLFTAYILFISKHIIHKYLISVMIQSKIKGACYTNGIFVIFIFETLEGILL
jgi:hypothetical protein